jgi:mono/diheme cytochrome c family protein
VSAATWVAWPAPGNPGRQLTDVEQRGEALYRANCASCHGTSGQGQPDWKSTRPDGSRPAPPHDATGHTWHHPDALLFGVVKEGGAYAAPPGYPATMPRFEGTLTDQQIVEVLTYVKTMWGDKEREYQAKMSEKEPFPSGIRR